MVCGEARIRRWRGAPRGLARDMWREIEWGLGQYKTMAPEKGTK